VRWRADSSREAPVLVDVREPWEFALCKVDGSLSMPLGELPEGRALVMICHTGRRSQHAAMLLATAGRPEVHNLAGGVEAWALEIDPAMKRY